MASSTYVQNSTKYQDEVRKRIKIILSRSQGKLELARSVVNVFCLENSPRRGVLPSQRHDCSIFGCPILNVPLPWEVADSNRLGFLFIFRITYCFSRFFCRPLPIVSLVSRQSTSKPIQTLHCTILIGHIYSVVRICVVAVVFTFLCGKFRLRRHFLSWRKRRLQPGDKKSESGKMLIAPTKINVEDRSVHDRARLK